MALVPVLGLDRGAAKLPRTPEDHGAPEGFHVVPPQVDRVSSIPPQPACEDTSTKDSGLSLRPSPE